MEPRNEYNVGADVFVSTEGSTRAPRGGETATKERIEAPARAKAAGNSYSPHLPPSSKVRRGGSHRGLRAGHEHEGPPGTWETRASPSFRRRYRERGDDLSERDGRPGVGAPHRTDEAGIAARATLPRERGVGSRN